MSKYGTFLFKYPTYLRDIESSIDFVKLLYFRLLYYEETDRREYFLYEWTLEATQIVLADDGINEFKDITSKKIATEVKYISSREVYRFFRRVDINKGDRLFKQSLRDQEVLLNRKKDKVSKCRRSQNQFVELICFYDAIRNKVRVLGLDN